MAGEIWCLAEQWKGSLSDATFEALALGRELSDALQVQLQAVLLGHAQRAMADKVFGVDRVLYVDNPAFAAPSPEQSAAALATLVSERKPRAVLITLTNTTWEIGALLAAKLRITYANCCKDVRVENGQLMARCVLYGGKMEVDVGSAQECVVFGLLAGVRPAMLRAETDVTVEEVAVAVPEVSCRFKGYREAEAGDIDITKQDVLVCVGRGIQTKDNIELAEKLAETFGGAVCGTRPVIDQGWLPLSRQVGRSGCIVKPKLYVAVGVSGAPEHVEGMKGSGLIVAINTDTTAPIFHVAHYGIAADAVEILPAITEVMANRKAKACATPH